MRANRWLVIGILLLGAGLRFGLLVRDMRFHPDEALFATFARRAAVNGDWQLHGPLDKTPLTIYVNAVSMMLFGVTPLPDGVLTLDVHTGEFAARIPGTFANILFMAVIYALAKRLYPKSPSVPVFALLLAALSPYALAFSATAFTDGLMLLCITLAMWMGSRGNWFAAGIGLALGFWCKQQALLTIPLVLMMGYCVDTRRNIPKQIGDFIRLMLPIVIGVGLLFLWDSGRAQITNLWTLAVVNNDPGRLARLDELLPRFLAWINLGQYLAGAWWVTAALVLLAIVALLRRGKRTEWLLALYIGLYLLMHWLIALNIYDRYLLLILPPMLLLIAYGLAHVVGTRPVSSLPKILLSFALLLLFSLLISPAFPIGGDHGENSGIDRLGEFLASKPVATIVYDHWLGWELGYYLGTWPDERLVFYPDAFALSADALLQNDLAPRYFPVPINKPYQRWLDLLRYDGFSINLVYDQPPFQVYELIPPRWVGCVSSAGSSWLGRTERFVDSCA